MGDDVVNIQKRNIAEWAQPIQAGIIESLFSHFLPGGHMQVRPGTQGKKTEDFEYVWDEGGPAKPFPTGMPKRPVTNFTGMEQLAQAGMEKTAKEGGDIYDAGTNQLTDTVKGGYQGWNPSQVPQLNPMLDPSRNPSAAAPTMRAPGLQNNLYWDAHHDPSLNMDYGGFMTPQKNPYLAKSFASLTRPMVERFSNEVVPQTAATFARAGSYGGSAQQETEARQRDQLGSSLGQAASELYGKAYQDQTTRDAAYRRNWLAGKKDWRTHLLEGADNWEQYKDNAETMDLERLKDWRGLTQAYTNLGRRDYQAGRDREIGAAGLAPTIEQGKYRDYGILASLGEDERKLFDEQNRVGYEYELEKFGNPERTYNLIGKYLNPLGGQTSESTAPGPDTTSQNVQLGISAASTAATIGYAAYAAYAAGLLF